MMRIDEIVDKYLDDYSKIDISQGRTIHRFRNDDGDFKIIATPHEDYPFVLTMNNKVTHIFRSEKDVEGYKKLQKIIKNKGY